jgi:hypothetical protein
MIASQTQRRRSIDQPRIMHRTLRTGIVRVDEAVVIGDASAGPGDGR